MAALSRKWVAIFLINDACLIAMQFSFAGGGFIGWSCMAFRAQVFCFVLNAVFAFVFTPSPLKLITCNKQWLNSVLLSSLLKFWVLVLNYRCPNKCVFYFFSQYMASYGTRILNTKKVGSVLTVFSIFTNLCLLPLRKTGRVDFPERRAPIKVKCLLPVCQILGNFTEGNARNFTVSFAFCVHVDVIKYRKTLTFSFERAQNTRASLRTGSRWALYHPDRFALRILLFRDRRNFFRPRPHREPVRRLYQSFHPQRGCDLEVLRKRLPSLSLIWDWWLVCHAKRLRRRLWLPDFLPFPICDGGFPDVVTDHERSAFLADHFDTPAVWIVLWLVPSLCNRRPSRKTKSQIRFFAFEAGEAVTQTAQCLTSIQWLGLLRNHQNTSARVFMGEYRPAR